MDEAGHESVRRWSGREEGGLQGEEDGQRDGYTVELGMLGGKEREVKLKKQKGEG